MTHVTRILVLCLIPASLLAQPPGPPEQSPGPAQSVIVENEPTVHIGNQPTVDIGNIVDVDAFITNESVPVDIVNEQLDVRVLPRTRAYTLRFAPINNLSLIDVPFDSYIAGVLFTAIGDVATVCPVSLRYLNSGARPGGSNSNFIAQADLHGVGSNWGDTQHITVPNMFAGQGVTLEFLSTSTLCSITAIVYLIPAVSGIVPPGGGIGLSNP